MTDTIQTRQVNPEETESMVALETPNNEVYGYIERVVGEKVGEFMETTFHEDDDGTTATLQKTTSNFSVYETPAGSVVGFGVGKDLLEDVYGSESPEEISISFSSSSEEEWTEEVSDDEEEINSLIA